MYSYLFNKKINVDNINELISILEEKEEVELWFSTSGGETVAMTMLIQYLNTFKGKLRLVITSQLQSAGTLLLSDFKGDLRFEELDFILFHLADRMRYPLRKDSDNFDDKIQSQDEVSNLTLINKFRDLGLTEKELKQMLKGRDVILYQEDFHRLKLNLKTPVVKIPVNLGKPTLQPYQQLIGSKDEKIY